jgi:hypothetical protein
MAYVSILIAGYLLGIFSVLILAALYLLHRPRYVAPTMHNRKWRDAPVVEKAQVPDEPIYMYGVTGEER